MAAIMSSRGFIVGPVGSDAGYWVFGPNGFHREGGWGQEAMLEVSAAIAVVSAASQVKTRGVQTQMLDLAHSMLKPHMEYVGRALDAASVPVQALGKAS